MACHLSRIQQDSASSTSSHFSTKHQMQKTLVLNFHFYLQGDFPPTPSPCLAIFVLFCPNFIVVLLLLLSTHCSSSYTAQEYPNLLLVLWKPEQHKHCAGDRQLTFHEAVLRSSERRYVCCAEHCGPGSSALDPACSTELIRASASREDSTFYPLRECWLLWWCEMQALNT